jgi:hypothetical protein
MITFFFCVFLFGMRIGLRISCKSNSCSTCENWYFNFSLSVPPLDSTSFHALGKARNALLATTLWGSTKLAMPTLELVKNGRVSVLSIMFSLHNMSFTFTKFEQQRFKNIVKKNK